MLDGATYPPRGVWRPVPIDAIVRMVSRHYACPEANIVGRRPRNCFPRQVAIWLAREYTAATWVSLGEFFSHRDHSSIVDSYDVVEELRISDELFARELMPMRIAAAVATGRITR